MQNGSSHVRKICKVLSAETLAQIAEEIQVAQATAQSQLGKQDANSAVGKLLSERITYLTDVQEIVGKVQFEKLGS